jgi:hypothetical protein
MNRSAHGLRKAAATVAAENGATEAELDAIFGWTDRRMASHCTKKANRKKLAYGGVAKLERMTGSTDHRANVYSSPGSRVREIERKAQWNQIAPPFGVRGLRHA